MCEQEVTGVITFAAPDDVYDFLDCPTFGCKGQGHIDGAKYRTHNNPKFCPYSEENLDLDKKMRDRLLSPDRELESVVPISRDPYVLKV